MIERASGRFDVKLTPMPADAGAAQTGVARMTLEKQFHGELEGTGQGQMLALRTAVDGSAGYVAMERVEGKLKNRSGSFVLQHSGTMNRGEASLVVSVVPDSGTAELKGLSGTMKIVVEAGLHTYQLDYTLPPLSAG